jgi:hypothetical protein
MMSQESHEESYAQDLLLGDFFHWTMDRTGHFVIEQNEIGFGGDFQTLELDAITERIMDE